MATPTWQTTFDLIGLAAYMTLMTGELPDSNLLSVARKGTGPREVALPGEASSNAGEEQAEAA